jgi:HPt (histidine-containing phosphotransfer) domain-containing protein
MRAQVVTDAATTGTNLKNAGVAGFAAGSAEAHRLQTLLAELRDYGVFLVPVGELEGWLSQLLIPRGNKNSWIQQMLPAIDAVPVAADDVWEFLDQVESWIGSPNRLGV